MKKLCCARQVPAALMLLLFCSQSSFAQATRTWVSGVGDDANPCSRTAPGKTFAGAISKTAAGGEIDALDPGGYGAVTITKSITIDGGGTFASILAAGTTGITVNAGPNDVVTIRNLSINGAGTGINGIRFIAGAALHVENCVISNFTNRGITFEPAAASRLFIKNTVVRRVAGGGVMVIPGPAGSAQATLDGVHMEGNNFALRAEDRSTVTVRNCLASGNSNVGIVASATAAAVVLTLESTVVSNHNAAATTPGIRSVGAQATVRLSNVTVVSNGVGLVSVTSGNIISFGNNRIAGNTTDGAPTATIAQQ